MSFKADLIFKRNCHCFVDFFFLGIAKHTLQKSKHAKVDYCLITALILQFSLAILKILPMSYKLLKLRREHGSSMCCKLTWTNVHAV